MKVNLRMKFMSFNEWTFYIHTHDIRAMTSFVLLYTVINVPVMEETKSLNKLKCECYKPHVYNPSLNLHTLKD